MTDLQEISRYYPADFDAKDVRKYRNKYIDIKRTRPTGRRTTHYKALSIRTLWPFNIACTACDTVMFVGTKFNARVRKLKDVNYLGVPIWTLEGKCHNCDQFIMIETDPKNLDYKVKYGGRRLFDRNVFEKQIDEVKKQNSEIAKTLNVETKLAMNASQIQNSIKEYILLHNLKQTTQKTNAFIKNETEICAEFSKDADEMLLQHRRQAHLDQSSAHCLKNEATKDSSCADIVPPDKLNASASNFFQAFDGAPANKHALNAAKIKIKSDNTKCQPATKLFDYTDSSEDDQH